MNVDELLLDRVFQPIVNRCQKHPLDLAITVAIGAAVMTGVAVLFGLFFSKTHTDVTENWITRIALLASLFGQGFGLNMFVQTAKMMRPFIKPGTRNPLRYLHRVLRPLAAGLLLIIALMLLGLSAWVVTPQPWFYSAGSALWAAMFYFQSCDYPPARPARVGRSWKAWMRPAFNAFEVSDLPR